MIDEGIVNGKYIETSDIRHVDLKSFQDFRHGNFKPTSSFPRFC